MSASNAVVSPSISFAAASTRSRERLAIATLTPSRASAAAIPRPIPLLAPITSAVFPSIPRSMRANYRWGTVRAMSGGDLYEQIVDAANDLYGSHRRQSGPARKGDLVRRHLHGDA